MDVDQRTNLPTAAALETLMYAAKLGLRLCREGASLVFKGEQRVVSRWVSAKFDETKGELTAFVPDLGNSNDCIVPIRPVANPEANVICVHPLNGSSIDYYRVAWSMAETCSIYGCDTLDKLFACQPEISVESMANHYIGKLKQSQLTQIPLILYGASSGGLIALEMARKMAAAGFPPTLLVLGDTRDPVPPSPARMHYNGLRIRLLWNAFIEAFLPKEMRDISPADHAFWKLNEPERLDYLRDRVISLQSNGEVLTAVDPGRIRDYFMSFRRYTKSYGEYAPQPYFGGALFLRASHSPRDATSNMISMLQGGARVQTIEGMHSAFFWPPVASVVAEAISNAIAASLVSTEVANLTASKAGNTNTASY